MAIRVLMRGGIYILFIIAAAAGWFIKRCQSANATRTPPVVSTNPVEPANALQSPQWKVRLNAVQHLARERQSDTLPTLVMMLNDADSDVRDAAVEAVAAFGESAIPALENALYEGQLNSREAAARALGVIDNAAAAPALIAALEDESAWVRIQAANALGGLGIETASVRWRKPWKTKRMRQQNRRCKRRLTPYKQANRLSWGRRRRVGRRQSHIGTTQ